MNNKEHNYKELNKGDPKYLNAQNFNKTGLLNVIILTIIVKILSYQKRFFGNRTKMLFIR